MLIPKEARFAILSGANASRDYPSFYAGKQKDGVYKWVKNIKGAEKLEASEADSIMADLKILDPTGIHFSTFIIDRGY